MKCEWKYFIVLITDDCYGDFVERAEIDGDGLPVCCDPVVARSFSSTEKLIDWVTENTSLNPGEYKIEGQFLPCDL